MSPEHEKAREACRIAFRDLVDARVGAGASQSERDAHQRAWEADDEARRMARVTGRIVSNPQSP